MSVFKIRQILMPRILSRLQYTNIYYQGHKTMERGGSVIECLTRDCGVAGSSLNGGTALCPLYPLLSTGSSQKDPSRHY